MFLIKIIKYVLTFFGVKNFCKIFQTLFVHETRNIGRYLDSKLKQLIRILLLLIVKFVILLIIIILLCIGLSTLINEWMNSDYWGYFIIAFLMTFIYILILFFERK